MKKAIILIVVIGIILIGGGIGAAYYYNEVSNYITTDDAMIQGDLVNVSTLATGRLTDWKVKEGDTVKKGEVLGTIEVAPASGKTAAQTVDITAPADGSIIKSNAIVNQTVVAGTQLATTADLNHLYVVANVLETDLNNIQLDKSAKITVDAFPGTTFDGHVQRLGLATTSTFSLLPSTNTSGNYTKVAQRVPVVITIDSEQGKALIPGLNAYVKIDR